MTRTPSQFYKEDADMQFQWATSDNDLFDREYDLYRLAQAVERHTHNGTTKGLPVEKLAGSALQTDSYAPNSIPNSAYMDGSITAGKIQAGGITDDRMQYPPLHKAGDTMTGDLRVNRAASSNPDIGFIFFGNSGTAIGQNSYLWFNNGQFILNNGSPSGNIEVRMDQSLYRASAPTTGYLFMGNAGHYVGYDGSKMVIDGSPILTSANTNGYPVSPGVLPLLVGVPQRGTIFLPDPAWMPGDGRWAQVTGAAGRVICGAGTTAGTGVTLPGDAPSGGSDWTLTAHLGTSHNLTAPAGAGGGNTGPSGNSPFLAASATSNNANGATNVSVADHVHPQTGGSTGGAVSGTVTITNKDQRVYPPLYAMTLVRRIS